MGTIQRYFPGIHQTTSQTSYLIPCISRWHMRCPGLYMIVSSFLASSRFLLLYLFCPMSMSLSYPILLIDPWFTRGSEKCGCVRERDSWDDRHLLSRDHLSSHDVPLVLVLFVALCQHLRGGRGFKTDRILSTLFTRLRRTFSSGYHMSIHILMPPILNFYPSGFPERFMSGRERERKGKKRKESPPYGTSISHASICMGQGRLLIYPLLWCVVCGLGFIYDLVSYDIPSGYLYWAVSFFFIGSIPSTFRLEVFDSDLSWQSHSSS